MAKVEKVPVQRGRLNDIALDEVSTGLSTLAHATFLDFAKLLKLDKSNHFRIKAVKTAAEIVLTVSLEEFLKNDKLTSIKGIGKELAEKIKELHSTGVCKEVEDLKAKYPDWEKAVIVHSKVATANAALRSSKATARYLFTYDENASQERLNDGTNVSYFAFAEKNVFETTGYIDTRYTNGMNYRTYAEIGQTLRNALQELGFAQDGDHEFYTTASREEAERLLNAHPLFDSSGGFTRYLAELYGTSIASEGYTPEHRYYWARARDNEEQYREDFDEFICVSIIPRGGWDREGRWDDGGLEYSKMLYNMHNFEMSEDMECEYTFMGSEQEFREMIGSNPAFRENTDIFNFIERQREREQ